MAGTRKSPLPAVTPDQLCTIVEPVLFDDSEETLLTGAVNRHGNVPIVELIRVRRVLQKLLDTTEPGGVIHPLCTKVLRDMEEVGITDALLRRPPFQLGREELDARIEMGELNDDTWGAKFALYGCVQLGELLEAVALFDRRSRRMSALVLNADDLLRIAATSTDESPCFRYRSYDGSVIRIEIFDNCDDEETLAVNAFDDETNARLHPPATIQLDDTFVIFPEQVGGTVRKQIAAGQ